MAFVLNDAEVARSAVGADKAFIARATIAYQPGTLTAVAYRDGAEIGRDSLSTTGGRRR